MHSKEFAGNQGDNQIRMNLFIPSSKQACSPNPFKKKIYLSNSMTILYILLRLSEMSLKLEEYYKVNQFTGSDSKPDKFSRTTQHLLPMSDLQNISG